MSKRFFYTDPLAAAYMSKHFGMAFDVNDFDGVMFRNWDNWQEFFFGNFAHIDGRIAKWRIAPDSLHLLDPRAGDAVEFDRWHWDRQRREDCRAYGYQAHFGLVSSWGQNGDGLQIFSAGIGWDAIQHGEKFSLPFKIIQRHGIPFMPPESEAA